MVSGLLILLSVLLILVSVLLILLSGLLIFVSGLLILMIVLQICFALYMKLVTPPLPLPYRGGERLPPCLPDGSPQALPSPVGEGQGWGH